MLIPLRLVRDQQLQQQLFDQLRDLISSNRLQPGSRMPSSRMMAEQFAISRMTVLLTYERLIAEGYLETRPAAGTFVAQFASRPAAGSGIDASSLALAHPPANVDVAERPSAARIGSASVEIKVGGADPSLFPAQRWRSAMRQGLDRIGTRFEVEHSGGNPALRDAIAHWLSTSRGLPVSADQVMLVKGRQQAFHVVSHLASHSCEGRRKLRRCAGAETEAQDGDDGDEPRVARRTAFHDSRTRDHTRIVVEDPCDSDAAAAMAGAGSELVRVAVDADGLRTDHLPPGGAALVHVTPEHQRPLGCVLARDRRIALLDWSAHAGALILEEDIDGELRYGDMNVPSLMSLDRSERVILLGGFGLSLGPWLDVAYLVLPRWLVTYAHTARRRIDDSRGSFEYSVLAGYLASGGYARHLHRLTKTYAGRRDALVTALRRHFGADTLPWGEHAGLHLAWRPPGRLGSAGDLTTLARRFGLDAAAQDDVVLLGFGAIDEPHIEAGIRRLADALQTGSEELSPIAAMTIGFAASTARCAQV